MLRECGGSGEEDHRTTQTFVKQWGEGLVFDQHKKDQKLE